MIVLLTAADTEILALSEALRRLPRGFPPVRAVHIGELPDGAAVDAWLAEHAAGARVVVLRLLGGRRSFEHGFERVLRFCRQQGADLIALPGHHELDLELMAASTVDERLVREAFTYLSHGGARNLVQLLRCLSDRLLDTAYGYEPPTPLPWEGCYHPAAPDEVLEPEELAARFHEPGRPTIGVLFYRAHWLSGNLAFVDALVRAIEHHGGNALPVFCYSLRASEEGTPSPALRKLVTGDGEPRVDVLVSTLSFALHDGAGSGREPDPDSPFGFLASLDVPVIQALVATRSRDEWEESSRGLPPLDVAMNVALPEFDGRVITVPVSFKEREEEAAGLGTPVRRYVPVADRVDFVARLALNWARLGRKPNAEKKIAILLTNYPSRDARIGNAVGLDTPASVVRILRALQAAGYRVDDIPADGDELMRRILEGCTWDREFLVDARLERAAGGVPVDEYRRWFAGLEPRVAAAIRTQWGEPPGKALVHEGRLVIPGLVLGNVFVGLQPPRGYGDDPVAIYHSPDLVPTHHYVAFYRWLRETFGADAVIHVGKHGTLEWLPGKAVGLSAACYPEVVLGDLPHFYPYIINNPGEGTQAKRRSHTVLVDHLIPAATTAGTYDELAELEGLLDEYYHAESLDPAKLPVLQRQIWEAVRRARLDRDLGAAGPPSAEEFGDFLERMDGYLCELAEAQIRDGLHILGEVPRGERLRGLLQAMVRLPNGDVPSLPDTLARALGLDRDELLAGQGRRWRGSVPAALRPFLPGGRAGVAGDLVRALEGLAAHLLARLEERGWQPGAVPAVVAEELGRGDAAVEAVLRYVAGELVPRLERTRDEIGNLIRGLDGRFVPPGPSGSPTRGQADILPTGRNFYSLDPKVIPTRAAWEVGVQLGRGVLERYLREEGRYPETVGIVVWGTSTMRTQGDDIAEILYLLGVRPLWQADGRRVTGIEVIPLEELGRPRIDVVVRISGFFRDAFPHVIELLDEAVATVAALDEPPEQNYVRKHVLEETGGAGQGDDPARWARAYYRIFGSKPGAYGAGLLPALHEGVWRDLADLARIYIAWGSYAYGRGAYGVPAEEEFKRRFAQIVVAVKNQDNREHDLLDSDDYFQFHGGMIATIRSLTGRAPRQYFGDSSDPARARVRDLADEVRRVFRTRVVNPKWLASIRRHGYKGAAELAATVEYLFGYDATAKVVEDWMYEKLAERYVLDPAMQDFFREKNPWALRDIAGRLLEAIRRGLWEKPSARALEGLRRAYLLAEGQAEEWSEG